LLQTAPGNAVHGQGPRLSVKQLAAQLSTQPAAGPDAWHVPHTPFGGHRFPRLASTQQLLVQVPPIEHTAVSWHVCVLQLAVVETQTCRFGSQVVLSAQSVFTAHPGWQRGCVGSLLQLAPSGQSVFATQPARQLFEPSGLASQICPLLHSESVEQSVKRKQALARQR